ncbi:gamma-glutamylcyclotransferase family protein [Thalassomonas sp. M1454]|uniref:gamma-glutamylcyclotransferase family protein n=1 Tax=Thalassomonas sp. M1454 TaxID=2594477 RepID=UPI0011814704|nr:gamma-glutamylcyclotransferase family protein [Thalassomonas sp. M1454]TRX58094.1 gamma-glutamylcyclotransferase [Thalassomonas sp. M1454]
MKYFAYGSNMSIARLSARVPSAKRLGTFILKQHTLKFHKVSHDGSGKCDAYFTQNKHDKVIGALFEIAENEKPYLDKVEGLGVGYNEKTVLVEDEFGNQAQASTYYAITIDSEAVPYCWYKKHVLIGARESALPKEYIAQIEQVAFKSDANIERTKIENSLHL